MSAVWKFSSYKTEKLLVLLALADCADEKSGECWPSIPHIAEKARITERGASGIMQHFIKAGVVELVDAGGGRGHSRRYRIKGEAHSGFDFLKGEAGSSFTAIKDERGSSKRMKVETLKGERGDTAIRMNRQEPSVKQPLGASAFCLPDWIPVESWNGFTEMRQKIRKPLTDRAVSLIVKELEKLKAKGHAPGDVLDQSVRNGWQDVYPLKGENQNGHAAIPARTRQNSEALRGFREYEARKNSQSGDSNR
jgi:hypothetical protein